ncbi:MAG: hypothetical protein JG766_1, partial [Desulfacinum sp.]|nr:hypothetical protein [Desulfacinum sp.]
MKAAPSRKGGRWVVVAFFVAQAKAKGAKEWEGHRP